MRFVAVDVETANADMASICSIGMAVFEKSRVVCEWYSLVDPNDYFDPVNISIHGIDAAKVSGAPTFEAALPDLLARVGDVVVVTHTHFDRVALHQASAAWGLPPPPFGGWTRPGLPGGHGQTARGGVTDWRMFVGGSATNSSITTRWRTPRRRGMSCSRQWPKQA